jgi:hypothetical protein
VSRQSSILFSVAMLAALLPFRWPVLLDNRQYPDPDESQFIAGATTLLRIIDSWAILTEAGFMFATIGYDLFAS